MVPHLQSQLTETNLVPEMPLSCRTSSADTEHGGLGSGPNTLVMMAGWKSKMDWAIDMYRLSSRTALGALMWTKSSQSIDMIHRLLEEACTRGTLSAAGGCGVVNLKELISESRMPERRISCWGEPCTSHGEVVSRGPSRPADSDGEVEVEVDSPVQSSSAWVCGGRLVRILHLSLSSILNVYWGWFS